MSPVLVATLCGLATACFWGVADWLTPRSKRNLTPWQINLVVSTAGIIIYPLIYVYSGPHSLPTNDVLLKTALGSAVLSVGYILFVRALTIGAVGVVVPLSSIYPLVTLALSVVILHQVFSVGNVIAMLLIMTGAVFLAYEKNKDMLPLRQVHAANLYTISAVILWGLAYFILNPLFKETDWQVMTLVLGVIGLFIAICGLVVVYKDQALAAAKYALVDRTVWTAALLLEMGTIAIYFGAGKTGNIIIPAVISSLSPLLATGLEAYVDKKQLGLLKRFGAVVAIGGIVLLNIS